jgi:hypothetical protein
MQCRQSFRNAVHVIFEACSASNLSGMQYMKSFRHAESNPSGMQCRQSSDMQCRQSFRMKYMKSFRHAKSNPSGMQSRQSSDMQCRESFRQAVQAILHACRAGDPSGILYSQTF